MNHQEIQEIAEGVNKVAIPSSQRPAEIGDLLVIKEVSARVPIRVDIWEEGWYGNEPPLLEPCVFVCGCFDVPRHQEGRLIDRAWGKAYVEGPIGPERITYSTTNSWVLCDTEALVWTAEMKATLCLYEALQLHGSRTSAKDVWDLLEASKTPVDDKWKDKDHYQNAAGPLLLRCNDAPILVVDSKPRIAPGYENLTANAIVRCALDGGKAAGVAKNNLPTSICIPAIGDHNAD